MKKSHLNALALGVGKATDLIGALEEAKAEIEDLHATVEGEFDDRSEKWQESEKGEAEREAIDKIQEIIDAIGQAIDELGDLESKAQSLEEPA